MNRDTAISIILDAARRELERVEESGTRAEANELIAAIDYLCDEIVPYLSTYLGRK